MANPDRTACPAGVWTKVGTNISVTNGALWRTNTKPGSYLFTYRETGETAPGDSEKGVPIFRDNEPDYEPLNCTSADLYVKAIGEDGEVEVHA
jgi:hypothetical protein